MLGSPILCINGMRTIMFQLSGFYCKASVCGRPEQGWASGLLNEELSHVDSSLLKNMYQPVVPKP